MFLEVLTPDKKLFEGDVISIIAPGLGGRFEILNNHAALISGLMQEGELKITTEAKEVITFPVKGGVVEVLKNKMIVLTES